MNKNQSISLATMILLGMAPLAINAAEDAAENAPELGVVDVETTQRDLSQTKTVITREDTEGVHFTNMNDALFSGTPGVSTSRRSETGFGGPNSGFLIRGLQGPHVPVFVDGIPIQVNNHFHARVDRYSSDMIERMEITRGASVLDHGASAVGGVVDIYTRVPGKGFSGFVQAGYGTYSTHEVFGDFGYGWDGGSVLFSASDRLTDGPPVINGGTAGIFAAEAHDLTNLNVKFTQALNDEWSVGLRASNAEEVPEHFPFATGVVQRRFGQDETDVVVHLDRKTATSNTLVALYDNTLDNFNGRYLNGVLVAGTLSKRKEDETGILARHTMQRGGGNSTTVGFNRVKYFDNRFSGSAEKDETYHASAYVKLVQNVSDDVKVDGGVRVTKGEDFDTNFSPEIGVVKHIDSTLAVRARAGKAFRVPRLGDNDAFDMPTLDVEDFDHAEIGINKLLPNGGGELDIAAWAMKGNNLIVTIGGRGGFQANTGEFSNKGLEVSYSRAISDHLSMYLAGTWMDLEVTTAAPQKIIDVGMRYQKGKIRADLALRSARDNAKAALADQDYTVLDGRIQYAVNDNVELFIDVDNITDTSYSTFEGFGAVSINVERLVMAGVRLTK